MFAQIFSLRMRPDSSLLRQNKSLERVSVPRNRLSPILLQNKEDSDLQTLRTHFHRTPRRRTRLARMRKDLSHFVAHRQRLKELSFVFETKLFN